MPDSWPKAAIFDLDGTLIDTLPDIRAALNGVLAERGFDPLPRDEVRKLIGKGAPNLMRKALAMYGVDATDADVEEGVEQFVANYNAAPESYGHVFDGVVPLLAELQDRGIKLAVCTNKQKTSAVHSLKAFGLFDWFVDVTGAGDSGFRKPDPRHLRWTLDQLGVSASNAVMIGDSDNDILAARDAGVRSILVSFGYHQQPLHEIGADVLIDRFDQVPAALAELAA